MQEEIKLLEQKKADVINKAEIIIDKHRHGPTANVPVFFKAEFGQFSNLEQE